MEQAISVYKSYKYRWVVLAVYMYISALTQLYWLNFAAIETFIEERFSISASTVMWVTLVFPLVQVILSGFRVFIERIQPGSGAVVKELFPHPVDFF